MWNIFAKEDGFPYQVQEGGHQLDFSFCSLYDGTHKTRGGNYSVFRTTTNSSEGSQYTYLNIQRLKTLRHPNVLTFVYHSEEEPYSEYVVTEKAIPLLEYLENMKDFDMKNEYIAWGIMKILEALIFCHESAKLFHNNVGSTSVFVNRAGEWKLAEFGISNESHCGPSAGTRAAQYHKWIKNNSDVTWELDTYGVAVLVMEAYEGRIHSKQSVPEPTDEVPEPFRSTIKSILNGEKIPTLKQLLEGAANGFRNDFIDKITFLEEIHLKPNEERRAFYENFHIYVKNLPGDIKKFKIFPLVMLSYYYGCEGSELLPSVLEFCKIKDADLDLLPMISRLYHSPSRKTRKALLENMSKYITILAPSAVNETIYPMWEVGFQDNSEIIRLETLKSTEYLVPLLNQDRVSKQLLPRLVQRLVEEKQGKIREMALKIVLVIIRNHVETNARKRLLLTVITKVLKDEHPPIKSAAIDSMVKLQDNFTQQDIATKLLPPLCLLTIDSSLEVKNSAIRAMRALLDKIEQSPPEEIMPEIPKRVGSWTEWAKTKISSRVTSIFLEDESPKQVDDLNRRNRKDERETMTTLPGQSEDDPKCVDLDQNPDWEGACTGDKPFELTNNNKELSAEDNNRTRRNGKKLKGPRKLGTRINQRK